MNPPTTSATTVSTPTSDDKVPKTLAPGRWTQLINAYQSQQIGGMDRIFPVQELLGTEPVLARILHEHEVSQAVQPSLAGRTDVDADLLAYRRAKPAVKEGQIYPEAAAHW